MDIAIEFIRAIGRLFLNPLLYIAILVLIFFGYQRVKRERKYFKVRILGGWTELKISWTAMVLSLVVSITLILIGAVLPVQFLIVLAILSAIFLIGQLTQALSPIILFALSFLVLVVIRYDGSIYTIGKFTIDGLAIDAPVAATITIVAGVLLIVESRLIRKWAVFIASPVLERTRRGGKAVAYISKGAWILPIFVLIPGEVIPNYLPYFPLLSFGEETYGLVVFPFIIGFKQLVRKMLPQYFYPEYSKSLLVLGQAIVISGITGYFDPLVAIVALLLGALLRIVITLVVSSEQKKDSYAVAPNSYGTVIAAVLPDSPAQKMGLKPGEIIKRVNGQEVYNERELYEALQINAALCKLEVIDYQNEIRLTQHAVHRDDHHRIGVLLAEK